MNICYQEAKTQYHTEQQKGKCCRRSEGPDQLSWLQKKSAGEPDQLSRLQANGEGPDECCEEDHFCCGNDERATCCYELVL